MIEKKFTPKRTVCKVTFKVPEEKAQKDVALVGDFNGWNKNADKLEKKEDGWQTTLRLKPKSEVRFRYFIDNERWENDDHADDFVPNEFGTEDSVLRVEE